MPAVRYHLRMRAIAVCAAFGVGLGLGVPIGETGNRLSIDLGFAPALRSDTSALTLSIGDAHRFDAP